MIVHAKVKMVEHKKSVRSSYKVGDEVIVEYTDLGWGVLIEGFWEWWMVGPDKPDFRAGDEVEITIRKVQ